MKTFLVFCYSSNNNLNQCQRVGVLPEMDQTARRHQTQIQTWTHPYHLCPINLVIAELADKVYKLFILKKVMNEWMWCISTIIVFQVGFLFLAGNGTNNNNRNRKSRIGKCLEELEERQRLALLSKRGSSEYIPTCRKDGSYATVQCHLHTKSCWCVSRGGRPVQGSAILLTSPTDRKRPNCAKYLRQGKSTTKRRSSLGKNNRKCKTNINKINVFTGLMYKMLFFYKKFLLQLATMQIVLVSTQL